MYNSASNTELDKNISELNNAVTRIQVLAATENRPLKPNESGIIREIHAEIEHLEKSKSPGPITLQGGARQTDSAAGGKSFRGMFGNKTLANGGFKDFNDFLKVLSSSRFDDRLQNTMSETVPSGGGFSVPEQFAGWLLDSALESEIVRPRATVWPMISDTLKAPAWDGANHTAGLHGGLTGTWIGELGANAEVFPKMRQITLNAKKLACYTSASNELVADGIDFDRQISTALMKTISWFLDYAFLQGTGTGEPLGVLNDPAKVTVTKETGQSASTIYYENVVKMYARLAPQCMSNAVWICSQTAIPELLTMSLAVGTGGAPVPAVLQSSGKFSLLGKEIFFSEKVPALGTVGDIILCDLSQYQIGIRKEINLDKSIHAGWSTDQSSYRCILRADGQGGWSAPLNPKAGSTLSWVVTLATRA